MDEFLDLNNQIIQSCLKYLLSDKTTKGNIIFATDSYADFGSDFQAECEITKDLLPQLDLKPRILKSREEQAQRTRKKAEVFTPAWLTCKMNNHCDDEWFERKDVFNYLEGETWTVTEGSISFPDEKKKRWNKYVDSRRIEITCGEAPYIVSRYDAATGEAIPIKDRVGILDRKLRVVNENTKDREEWFKWALRAFQSVYGYEWQGDSLLIARINLLMTYIEYYTQRWEYDPTDKELTKNILKIANVIAWNFWQMDGLQGTIPYKQKKASAGEAIQSTIFDMGWDLGIENEEDMKKTFLSSMREECLIFDWRGNKSMTYNSLKRNQN